MDIREVHTELAFEAKYSLAVVTGDYPISERGGALEELSRYFQGLAICHLLENADTEQFRENLVRSGHARRYFLLQSRGQGNRDDRRLAVSHTEAFLDVLAAADLWLAREIANLSVVTWNPAWEYEDDFAYYHFLHTLILSIDEPDDMRLGEILTQFEKALEGASSQRLEICMALLERDEELFDESLLGLVDEMQEAYDARRDALESYEFLFWPRSFVSTEGLALLQLAGLLDMPTREAYPLCPSSVRLTPTEHGFVDLFTEVERLQ